MNVRHRMGSHPKGHMNLWSRGLARSRYKLKALFLNYHSAYGHQNWQDGDSPSKVSTHKVTWPFWLRVFRDVTN